MKTSILLFSIVFSSFCNAANTWYWGKVTQIVTNGPDGSFHVYVDNQDLMSVCSFQRVDVLVANLGLERTKTAMSLALSAFHGGQNFGVVVDLPAVAGTVCEVPSSSSQGAGIKSAN